MCSNYESISPQHNDWVKLNFNINLPFDSWRAEIYPTYPAPFIYLENGKPKCELAQFGLFTPWATDKKKFSLRT